MKVKGAEYSPPSLLPAPHGTFAEYEGSGSAGKKNLKAR